jgi:nitroreductase
MKNEILECIYTRRSIRRYLDKPVPDELIEELLRAAVMAPSARNTQPWKFTVITNRDEIGRLGRLALKQQQLLGKMLGVGSKVTGIDPIFYAAPLLIFISGQADYKYLKDDVNLAVQNMFLAAHSLGLGSCWIGLALPLNKDKKVLAELGIPKKCEIVAPLIFGYPAQIKDKIPERKPEVIKWIR